MTQRYFVEQPITASAAVLSGAEAHHLMHVMRMHTGELVTLFDGSGAEFAASVSKLARGTVELAVLSRCEVDRELPLCVTLAVALPKGDRQRWLVEKAVELGVSRLLPLETERGVAQPAPAALDRLRRTVIEASKQCGRNRLMEVLPSRDFTSLAGQSETTTSCWLAHFGGEPATALSDYLRAEAPAALELAVGPEGGFSDPEVAAAQAHGWRLVDLGARTLRVETAAAMLASLASLFRR